MARIQKTNVAAADEEHAPMGQLMKIRKYLAVDNHRCAQRRHPVERINAATTGRHDLMTGRTSLNLGGCTARNVFLNIKNRSKINMYTGSYRQGSENIK